MQDTSTDDLPDFVQASMRAWGDEPLVCDHLVELAEAGGEAEGFIFLDMLGCPECTAHSFQLAVKSGVPYECAACGEMTEPDPLVTGPAAGTSAAACPWSCGSAGRAPPTGDSRSRNVARKPRARKPHPGVRFFLLEQDPGQDTG